MAEMYEFPKGNLRAASDKNYLQKNHAKIPNILALLEHAAACVTAALNVAGIDETEERGRQADAFEGQPLSDLVAVLEKSKKKEWEQHPFFFMLLIAEVDDRLSQAGVDTGHEDES